MIITVTLNPCIDKTIITNGFVYGGLNRVKDVREDIGGKGINVAKVLKKFGASVMACGISAGGENDGVTKYLNESGIQNVFVDTEGKVRTNIKLVDNISKITTEINECGFNVGGNTLGVFLEKIDEIIMQSNILVLSGSIPSGINDDIYEKLTLGAKQYGVKVIIDADGEKLRCGIKASPYAIKPNLYELEQLTGKKLDTDEKIIAEAKKLVLGGTDYVIVSMGADGAIFVSKDCAYRSRPFEIECKSTVAAGDSMVAALAYAIEKDYSFEQTARFATAAGTLTAAEEGSQVCSFDSVTENMPRVIISEIKL